VLVATLFSFPALANGSAKEADQDPAVLADQQEPTLAPAGDAAEKPSTPPTAEDAHKAKDAGRAHPDEAHKTKAHKTKAHKSKAHKTKAHKTKAHETKAHETKAKRASKAEPKKVAEKSKAKPKKHVVEKTKPKPTKPAAVKVTHNQPAKHGKPATIHASHKPAEKPVDIVQ
jgi:hypothetical protein